MDCKRSALLVVPILIFSGLALGQDATSGVEYSFLGDPDFWLATGVNLAGIGLFASRVHAPEAARWFGYGTQLLGIPSLALGLSDMMAHATDLSTWGNLGYAAWALGVFVVDHVLGVEYRNPANPAILIPYVATYYIAIGFQTAVLLDKDITPWAIAGIACVANVAASIYARLHESP